MDRTESIKDFKSFLNSNREKLLDMAVAIKDIPADDDWIQDDEWDEIIAVCNFVPVSREGYRIGVPSGGKYTVVMNSDWKKYGGETDETKKVYVTDEEPMHSFDDSISLDLPAMSVIYLKQTAKKRKSATKKAKN